MEYFFEEEKTMIKEINRRCDSIIVEGLADSNATNLCVVSEVEIEEDGRSVFITCEWIDALSRRIICEVTSEPIMDMLLFRGGSPEKLEEIRNNPVEPTFFSSAGTYTGKYTKQYETAVQILKETLTIKGYGPTRNMSEEEAIERGMGWGF